MTQPTTHAAERRRHPRMLLKGSAIVMTPELSLRGRIANLGEGGLLATTVVTPPSRLLGRSVDLEIRLDGQSAQWLRASGHIIRIGAERIAVSFTTIPPTLIRLIDEMRAAWQTRRRIMSVVIIDANTERRTSMVHGFHAVGCTVIEAATALEAIVRLGEANFEPDLIAVANSIPTEGADDIREFVARDHPKVKLVTIGDEVKDPIGFGLWLSSQDPSSDLAQRIRELFVGTRQA